MIALLGALREEVSDLRRQMGLVAAPSEPTCRLYAGVYRGRDVLLAQTGMGRQRAESATQRILERYPVTTLISLGFAGGLTDELEVGDVVVCAALRCGTGRKPGSARPGSYRADEDLLRLATEALEATPVKTCIGTCVTEPQISRWPEEKQELGRAFRAQIVDMESYWITRIAHDWQIPTLTVRAVSDTWRDVLPLFDEILTLDGRFRLTKAIPAFLRHPRDLAALLALSRNARLARTNLTAATKCLVASL